VGSKVFDMLDSQIWEDKPLTLFDHGCHVVTEEIQMLVRRFVGTSGDGVVELLKRPGSISKDHWCPMALVMMEELMSRVVMGVVEVTPIVGAMLPNESIETILRDKGGIASNKLT
jgi:hypothetical protein